MRILQVAAVILAIMLVSPVYGLEKQAYQMREEYGEMPLSDCTLQYYYYIPCPEYSWFWNMTGWEPGDVIGVVFNIGDLSTGGWAPCSATDCTMLEQLRVLDFSGYCNYPRYPDWCTVEMDVYCADEMGCPVGPSLWNSGHAWRMNVGWNYVTIDPPISICGCAVDPGPPPSGPRILVTATHGGTHAYYPAWGFDNISTAVEYGCAMHDFGCLPAVYPRPSLGYYPVIHSGFYGKDFEYCPPQWFRDGRDSTPDASQYGFIELAWRLYAGCPGPSDVETTTWGSIKSMYR